MVKTARSSLDGVDAVLLMLDASSEIGAGDRYVASMLSDDAELVIPVLNKIDLVKNDGLAAQEKLVRELGKFQEPMQLSALHRRGISELMERLIKMMPSGPKYYPDAMVTDHPERFIVSELIREKILLLTREEIPHSVAIVIEHMNKRDEKDIVDIGATIWIEKDSQKGILIGKSGDMLKKIGSMARHEIESVLGSQIFLELWVKVKKDWRESDAMLKNLGYNPDFLQE
jgi:GTP-binding protein Era